MSITVTSARSAGFLSSPQLGFLGHHGGAALAHGARHPVNGALGDGHGPVPLRRLAGLVPRPGAAPDAGGGTHREPEHPLHRARSRRVSREAARDVPDARATVLIIGADSAMRVTREAP